MRRIFDIEIGEYGSIVKNYDNAVDFCKSIGPEWRLPSLKELRMLRENPYKKFFNLFPMFYWTNKNEVVLTDEYPDNNLKVYVYNLGTGRFESRFSKNLENRLAVLPVRNIDLVEL